MPLNTISLKNSLQNAFVANLTSTDSQMDQIQQMADAIAEAVKVFVEV